jgi:hypothetical protein
VTVKSEEGDKKTSKRSLNCGMKGQLSKDFWYKESNKSKRPAYFNKNSGKRRVRMLPQELTGAHKS